MPFTTTWMDLKIRWTKWSKPDKERQISYDITYMWNFKKMQIDLFYKTEIIQWETCHDFSGLNVPLGEKKVKKEKKKKKTEKEIDPWT